MLLSSLKTFLEVKKAGSLNQVLLSDAEFFFLDEPTNHLDLDMIEWLESHLSTSKSTILMVTHDRYFLEVVCDTIFELAEQSLFKYKGNFSYYWKKKPKDRSKCNPPLKKREILSGRSWIGFEDNLKQEEQNKKQEWMLLKKSKKQPLKS